MIAARTLRVQCRRAIAPPSPPWQPRVALDTLFAARGDAMPAHASPPQHTCAVCGKSFTERDLMRGSAIRPVLAHAIAAEHPAFDETAYICRTDLNHYRARFVHELIEAERGDVSALEREVVQSLRAHDLLSRNVERDFERTWTRGERLADRIATFGGSWLFLACFALFILAWVVTNTVLLASRPPDPYPFILLNLLLSCLAAIQAPIIMMSQNRKEARDRLRSQHDYQVNLKAELEIRHLHEKLDHLLMHQWERLVQIQEIQLELLTELNKRR